MHEKSRSGLAIALGGLALLVGGGSVRAQANPFCHCPPPLRWCSEQAPCVKFKCACPRPVCDPCDLPHYGVFATCWHPWPFQPNWSHCQTPPPGVVLPAPAYPPYTPRAPQDRRTDPVKDGAFPAPRRATPKEMDSDLDSPQVRNTAYRDAGQPPAPVREVPQAPAPLLLPTLGDQIIETPPAPVQKPQATHGGIRLIR